MKNKIKKTLKNIITKIKKIKPRKIMRDIKKFINKITDKEFLKENIRGVILGILSFIFLVSLIAYFAITRSISKIEEVKINTESREYANYIEDITEIKSKDIDKYIIYALDYSTNVNNQNKLTSSEISNFLTDKLNKKIKEEDIKNFGVNKLMLERNITYNNVDDSYILNDQQLDRQTLAKKELVYYKQKVLKKINKKKYVITYEKYIIKDPYEMLNYFLEENRNSKEIKNKDGSVTTENTDISLIKNYLITGQIKDIKHFLNENDKNINKFAKKDGKIKIIYIVNQNNELNIYKIR